MGTQLSGLAQLVASLEGRTNAETDLGEEILAEDILAEDILAEDILVEDTLSEEILAASAPPPASLEAFDQVARAVASARQRLEALSDRVTELRRLVGGEQAQRTPPVG